MLKESHHLHAHSPVVIRAFPETGFVLFTIHGVIGTDAPIPFAVLFIYKLGFDKLPAIKRFLQSIFLTEMLVEIHVAYYRFCLHPPMAVGIEMAKKSGSIVLGFIKFPIFVFKLRCVTKNIKEYDKPCLQPRQ